MIPYGTPIWVVELGVTHVPKGVFEMYLKDISPRYTAETYSLLADNCNNFTNEVAQFLVDVTVPAILQLPNEVLNSLVGALLCEFSSTYLSRLACVCSLRCHNYVVLYCSDLFI